jgi:hypothetical protein
MLSMRPVIHHRPVRRTIEALNVQIVATSIGVIALLDTRDGAYRNFGRSVYKGQLACSDGKVRTRAR